MIFTKTVSSSKSKCDIDCNQYMLHENLSFYSKPRIGYVELGLVIYATVWDSDRVEDSKEAFETVRKSLRQQESLRQWERVQDSEEEFETVRKSVRQQESSRQWERVWVNKRVLDSEKDFETVNKEFETVK